MWPVPWRINASQGEARRLEQSATEHGAAEAPYVEEVADLNRMIEWYKERLFANPLAQDIWVGEVSVGSLRYHKATLIHAAWVHEQNVDATAKSNWPSADRRLCAQVFMGPLQRDCRQVENAIAASGDSNNSRRNSSVCSPSVGEYLLFTEEADSLIGMPTLCHMLRCAWSNSMYLLATCSNPQTAGPDTTQETDRQSITPRRRQCTVRIPHTMPFPRAPPHRPRSWKRW